MPKLYKAWPGTNRFLPCGCIMGPLADISANFCVYFLILGALIPYCIFVLGDIWKITPVVPILLFLSIIVMIIFLNLTQCTDPGIIPRRTFLQQNPTKYSKYLNQITNPQNPTSSRRFCSTCKIFRPPKASHCSTCDNCIEVFDHHCPFVNNCVGKRNYRFFVCFLGSVMLTFVVLIANLILFFVNKSGSSVNSVVLIVICSVVVAIIALPLLGFFIFHLYLVITGRTTRQIIKHVDEQKQQIQWCNVDPPLIDYFQQVPSQKIQNLKYQLKIMQFTPQSQIKNMQERQIRQL